MFALPVVGSGADLVKGDRKKAVSSIAGLAHSSGDADAEAVGISELQVPNSWDQSVDVFPLYPLLLRCI